MIMGEVKMADDDEDLVNIICRLSVWEASAAAGFPSPADDFLEQSLDLNKHLIRHPEATYLVRVKGDSMINAGIHSGDILIVDRALDATDNRIIVACIYGELYV